MDVLEGIFICGAPGCLRSFLARSDFDNHISDVHAQLLLQEQGRLSPEVNVSTSSAVPEAQVTI
jgi:E3 ubiquitin-protein ligase Hakai